MSCGLKRCLCRWSIRRGHAQVDFGEAIGVIGGVERKIHFFAFDLPHSDALLRGRLSRRDDGSLRHGHVRAFSFFGGVPQSILYDNTFKIAVACNSWRREARQRDARFRRVATTITSSGIEQGRPGKGNDKGKVEGLAGYARRNFLVPPPVFEELRSVEIACLLDCCCRRMAGPACAAITR